MNVVGVDAEKLDAMSDTEFKTWVKQQSFKLQDEDHLDFPKASIDAKLISLQKAVTEFLASVIVRHELAFYQAIKITNIDNVQAILGTTNQTINNMIAASVMNFYNGLYRDIVESRPNTNTEYIFMMCDLATYGPHILLDKLFRLTIDIHFDVIRENLSTSNLQKSTSNYEATIINAINICLQNKNLLHILSKGMDEDSALPSPGPSTNLSPFSVTIEHTK